MKNRITPPGAADNLFESTEDFNPVPNASQNLKERMLSNRATPPSEGHNVFENFEDAMHIPEVAQKVDDFVLRHKSVLQPIVQTGTTGMMVATFCYPLEVLQTWRQVGMPASMKFTGPLLIGLKPVVRPLAEGYVQAQKASLLRNGVVANRENVHSKVDEYISKEEPQTNIETTIPGADTNIRNKALGIGVTSMVISSSYTLLSSIINNKRLLKTLLMEVPEVVGVLNKMKFAAMCMPARGTSNLINTGILTMTTVLQVERREKTNNNKDDLLFNVGSSMVSGGVVGLMTNWLDVITKKQMQGMDKVKLVTPSIFETARKIHTLGGNRAFMKGCSYSMLMNVAAFSAMGLTDFLVNEKLFSKGRMENYHRRHSPFHHKAESPTLNEAKTDANNVSPKLKS